MQLIARPRIQFIEKIIETENGTFLGRFAVLLEGSGYKVKLIEMIPYEVGYQIKEKAVLALPSPKTFSPVVYEFFSEQEIISPYNELLFFVSQPTRAPSF